MSLIEKTTTQSVLAAYNDDANTLLVHGLTTEDCRSFDFAIYSGILLFVLVVSLMFMVAFAVHLCDGPQFNAIGLYCLSLPHANGSTFTSED